MIIKFIQGLQEKWSKMFLNLFIGALGLLVIKIILNISKKSIPFSWNEIFSMGAFYNVLITAILFYVLFNVGDQLKRALGVKQVTTGIIAFFSITFLGNILLGLLDLSKPNLESMMTYFILIVILGFRFFSLKDKSRYYFLGGLLLSAFIIYILPKTAFPFKLYFSGSEEHGLKDISYFWFPSSFKYFTEGLVYSMQNNPYPGYSLFVQHIVVTAKRLVMFNPNTLDAYYFSHYVFFVISVYWFKELMLEKRVKVIMMAVAILCEKS